jgi:hypothetical protein
MMLAVLALVLLLYVAAVFALALNFALSREELPQGRSITLLCVLMLVFPPLSIPLLWLAAWIIGPRLVEPHHSPRMPPLL